MMTLRTDNAYTAGDRVEVAFVLTQHSRYILLMKHFVDYLIQSMPKKQNMVLSQLKTL